MYNWLDIVLIVILFITCILGLIKGFVRQLIGIIAVIAGLILAIKYYSYVSILIFDIIRNRVVSNFLGFLSIFLVVLLLGGLLAFLLSKLMKGPFKFFEGVLGF
jgi:membrane protein required for colicin V production